MKDKPNIEEASDKPDLNNLIKEIQDIATLAGSYYSRAGLYYDIRYCLWPGQSDDGKKWSDALSEPAFPWDGASDTRVRLADKIIRERTWLRKMAFWSKRVKATPFGSQNQAWAATANLVLRWLLYRRCLAMLRRELELVSSWTDAYGSCVLGVFWEQETRMQVETQSLEQLAQMAEEAGNEEAAKLVGMIADPLQADAAGAVLAKMLPHLTPREVEKLVKDLREGKEAEVRTPYVFKQRPQWIAMRPFIDVFFRPTADDLQRERLVAYREFLTEAELRDRVETMGWDEGFVEEALKHKGASSMKNVDVWLLQSNRMRRSPVTSEDLKNLVEIWHCFTKAYESTSTGGATTVYRTIFQVDVKDSYALHERLEYTHNELPFVVFRAEVPERPIAESRGIPEICATWQQEIKTTRDFHKDRESMEVLPPLQVPRGQAGSVVMGPAQQIERRRPGDYEFLSPHNNSPSSGFSLRAVEKEIDEYFGRAGEGVDPQMVMAARQVLVTDFLTELTGAIDQTFKLAQQYLSDDEIRRVAGALPQGVDVSRETIQGGFDLEFSFDVRTLNTEFIETIGGVVRNMVLPMDRAGIVDTTALIEILLGAIDPWIAERVVQSPQTASIAEVEDEQGIIAKMMLGIEPPMKPVGNPALRMQTLQQTLQTNPGLQQAMQNNQIVAALVQNRAKMLQFSQQQQANADIGRFGAQPILNGDAAAMNGGAQ